MVLSHSLATAVLACLFAAAAAYGQQDSADSPALEVHLQKLGQLAKEANELKNASRLDEFRVKYAEAGAVHQQAADELAKQQRVIDEARHRLDVALNQIVPPQIMVQAILAEAQDLDDAVLQAACSRVNAEAVDGDPARNIEPSIFSMSSEQAGKLLAAIEKRCPTQVVSRPSVLAVDGQIAEISVGQQVKTQTATRNEQGETRFKPGVEVVGLNVSLTPTIENNRQARIALAVKNSSLTGSEFVIGTKADGEVVTSPIINSNKMETTLKATDGRTILVAFKSLNVRTSATTSPKRALKFLKPGNTDEPTKTTLVLLTPRVLEKTVGAGEILHH